MSSPADHGVRPAIAVLVVAIAFIATAAILMQAMPDEKTRMDYLVIGTAATFVSLVAVFLLMGRQGLFFRRRKR
jgi:hypothetical protein